MPSSEATSRPRFDSRVDGDGHVRIFASDDPANQWLAAPPSDTTSLEDHT